MYRHPRIARLMILSALLAGIALTSALAQDAGPALPPPKDLGVALTGALLPAQGIVLAVDADKVPLPKDAVLPGVQPSVAEVADAFGRTSQRFGVVTAVAPPTMVVLNTSPSNPDPYDGMPPGDAFKLLAASLSEGQWRALTGAGGLGLADLTNDLQRGLFRALFPAGHLKVHLRSDPANLNDDEKGAREIGADDLAQARLRLGRSVELVLPQVGRRGGSYAPNFPGVTPVYETSYENPTDDADVLYGVRERAEVPNAPKESQLSWKMPVLAASIPLQGLKTVGDLVYRIGSAAHLELYPDRLYEGRALTVYGGATTAPAGDLLRAVAFCLCGAYRQVGPAFVLTDDLMGMGTRRAILHRFEQSAEVARHGPLEAAGDKVLLAHSLSDLQALDSQTDFDPEEMKGAHPNGELPNSGTVVDLPLPQLTPEQQALARRAKEVNDGRGEQARAYALAHGQTFTPDPQLTLDGKIMLMTLPKLELLTPTLDGPIVMNNYLGTSLGNLFNESPTHMQQRWREGARSPTPPSAPPPAPPALAPLLQPYRLRAVMAAPRTAAQVDAVVASMKKIGLNALWLPVFSGGAAHVPGVPLSDAPSSPQATDVLTEALRVTKGTGIAVVPVLDLLVWGNKPPADAVDLTLLGETSGQAAAARVRYEYAIYQGMTTDQIEDAAAVHLTEGVAVCPTAPLVQEALTALVHWLAATPGVNAMVLRATVTTGYDNGTESHYATLSDGLGYTVAQRLAFLRREHTDPIDLDDLAFGRKQNTVVPSFDNVYVTYPLTRQWGVFRAEADLALLKTIFAAAQRPTGRPLRLLVEERRQGAAGSDWFGTWDSPRAPLPELSEELAYSGPVPAKVVAGFAKQHSAVAVPLVPVWHQFTASDLAQRLDGMKGLPWDGFVLDSVGPPESPGVDFKPGVNPLAGLAEPEKPTVPGKTTPSVK